MVKQFLKKKSKRQSARHRYKVEKKVREHKRKVRKEAKKSTLQKRKKKDPGIPNSLPFKESILKEAEERKRKIEEERERMRAKRKREREKLVSKRRNLEGLVKDAKKKTAEYEKKKGAQAQHASQFTSGKAVESSLKAYYKEFRKVVDAADVVLQVLDARDPLGSRCQQMEEIIISSGTNKRLVLVLNKIDLVPRENVEAWLKHLRNEFPTVAFKASTQTQNENLSRSKVPVSLVSDDLLKSSRCIGADILMKLLGNYCRNQEIKTAIRVGVVGFPNTGKSSIINSLKRGKACNVGAMPGVTKTMQEVQLDKHIKLLDSPGVVMVQSQSDTSVILRNCVKLESLQDPIHPVEAILRRCSKEQMMLHYNLADYKDVNQFLALLATRMGKLRKGGVPDVDKAARFVLQDWTTGKITYYTHPPEQHTLPTHVSAQFVQKMGKEFSLDEVIKEEEAVLEGLEPASSKHILVETLGPAKIVMDENDLDTADADMSDENDEIDDEEDEEEMETDEESDDELKSVSVPLKSESEKSSRKSSISMKVDSKQQVKDESKLKTGLLQMNKSRKKDFKKMKKQRKRSDKLAGELSNAFTTAFEKTSDEAYDFSVL